ncbi:MAG: hypothetical protein ACFFEN_03830 [Candidatus Thorarchaeota archaeon]
MSMYIFVIELVSGVLRDSSNSKLRGFSKINWSFIIMNPNLCVQSHSLGTKV